MKIRHLDVVGQSGYIVPAAFSDLVKTIDVVLDGYAPYPSDLSVTAVLAGDFPAAVEEAWRLGGHTFPSFDAERLGGQVIGKSIAVSPASAHVIIDAAWWHEPRSEPLGHAQRMSLIAHELFHPRLDRRRVEARCDDILGDITTLSGGTRWMMRDAMDEMRCDLAADFVLKAAFAQDVGQGAGPLPFGFVGMFANASYVGEVVNAFDQVLPTWQVILNDPRSATSTDAFNIIARDTGRLLKLLAHAEAEVRSIGGPGAFGLPENAHHPVGELIQPTWQRICSAFDRSLGFQDLPSAEFALMSDGDAAVRSFWESLGFTAVL